MAIPRKLPPEVAVTPPEGDGNVVGKEIEATWSSVVVSNARRDAAFVWLETT